MTKKDKNKHKKFVDIFSEESKKLGLSSEKETKVSVSGLSWRPDLIIKGEEDKPIGLIEVKSGTASSRDIISAYEAGEAIGADKKIVFSLSQGTPTAFDLAKNLDVDLFQAKPETENEEKEILEHFKKEFTKKNSG